MHPYRVVAVSNRLAEKVRSTLRSPGYGHPAHVEVATGHGPCRSCLRDFEIGAERRILFTLDAFDGVEELPLPGPAFIHEAPCKRYPEDAGLPPAARAHALSLDAYARGRRLVERQLAPAGTADAALASLLARPEVDYVQVHDTAAGCYDFRVERRDAGAR